MKNCVNLLALIRNFLSIGVQSANLALLIKKRIVAKEHEREDIALERKEWENWQKNCKPERIICLDESSVKTNYTPLRGWGERGKRIRGMAPGHWQTYTVLSYLTYDGKTDSLFFQGDVTKIIFREFMEEILLPATKEGDIIILDNLRVHKNSFNKKLFEDKGIIIKYIPRYSPEYNPIEMMWSVMKSDIRKKEPREFYDIWRETSLSLLNITPEMTRNWYRVSGYSH